MDPIRGLRPLRSLWLFHSSARVDVLSGHPQLRWLHIAAKSGWAGLRHLPKLRYLSMTPKQLANLTLVRDCPLLRGLSVTGRLRSLAGIEDARDLRLLRLETPPLDLAPIADLPLEQLGISGSHHRRTGSWDMTPVRQLRALRRLHLELGTAEDPGVVPGLDVLAPAAPIEGARLVFHRVGRRAT